MDVLRRSLVSFSAFLILLASGLGIASAASGPQPLYSGMQWRLVGPFLGGRVEAVAGVPSQPDTFYFGAVVGGVWKTTDAGNTWHPIFDKEPVGSIGAIAVAPSDPNVIYVGTGERAPRGDISFGNGVYKSTDGGKTWQHMGLDDSRHIGRILVDPKNPDVILAAALGHVYGPNKERGVFRSTDGGNTWTKVLYKNENTGAIDLAADPKNPRIVYAALWQVRRTPWSLTDGGPGSGLYRSTDGGKTWTQLQGHGLPAGPLGRISVSVSGANGNIVYALINAHKGGLYRSDDGGATWQLINGDQHLRQRPWYYFGVHADPKNPDKVWVLNFKLNVSTDGGKSFKQVATPHVDNHAMWIDPRNPERIIEGNDGGATVTVNGGESWSSEENQPTGQFYHVATDDRFPYRIYGAQQDRGSIAIANASRFGPITTHNWYNVAGGESGYVVPVPGNPDVVYAGSYFGNTTRYTISTGEVQDVTPWPLNPEGQPASKVKYRFSWTSPLAFSPQDPKVLYSGSQYVLESTDSGHSWHRISPDLTRDDKSKQQLSGGPITKDNVGAEYYDVVYTIAPSPVKGGVIWAGTDDGLIHITRDGGKHWENVTPRGMPKWATVSLIDASTFDAGTAYAAVNAHKSDDMTPYIYRTRDYGRSWTRITNGIDAPAYVHVVREDPDYKGLLFAGTETGAYVSFNDGGHWYPLQMNLPVTSVRDFAVKDGDLIVATHGRGFWVLDDIAPLEQITAGTRADGKPLLFKPGTAIRTNLSGAKGGTDSGSNPDEGALLTYYLPAAATGGATLKIVDSKGTVIRKWSSTAKKSYRKLDAGTGSHRLAWNLRYAAPTPIKGVKPVFEGGFPVTPAVVPGTYTAELTVDGHTYRQPVTVKLDPRLKATPSDLRKQLTLMLDIHHAIDADHRAFNGLYDLHGQLERLAKRLGDAAKQVRSLAAEAEDIAGKLFQYKAHAPKWLFMNYPGQINMRLVSLEYSVSAANAAPTAQQEAVYAELHKQLQAQLARWDELRTQKIPALNASLHAQGVPVISAGNGSEASD